MKARIRGTNVEVDVLPFYDETGYFAGFKNDYEYYRAADLVFPDTPNWDNTDWPSFRREAAKEILCALMGREDGIVFRQDKRAGELEVSDAIYFADELIRQLKNGNIEH